MTSSTTEPKVDVQKRVDAALGVEPQERRGPGRPTNDELEVRLTSQLERVTGRKVKLVGPDDPPDVVQVGDLKMSMKDLQDFELEGSGSLTELFKTGSETWADAVGDNDKVRLNDKTAKALGASWNRALTLMMKRAWITSHAVYVAIFQTVIYAAPRVLITVRYFGQRKKLASPKVKV